MNTKLINRNMVTVEWAELPADINYVGDDLWAYDDKRQLVFFRTHVASREAAGSKVLKARPAVLDYLRDDTPIATFADGTDHQSTPAEPLYHWVYESYLGVVYPGWDSPVGAIRVIRPTSALFILMDSLRVLQCVVAPLNQFEIQLTGPGDRVSLSTVSESSAEGILQLLADDWINGDTDELLPMMIKKWEQRLIELADSLPGDLLAHARAIVQGWREMSED